MKKSIILFILSLMQLQLAYAMQPVAKILYAKGSVTIIRNSDPMTAQKSQELLLGDIVRTGVDGIVIISYLHKSKIKLDSNSSILIEQMKSNKKEKSFSLKLYIMAGNLIMELFNLEQNKDVVIRTRAASFAVRGTKFFVGYDDQEKKEVYLGVKKGVVEVFQPEQNDSQLVKSGEGTFIHAGKKITRALKYKWVSKLNWNLGAKRGLKKTGFISNRLARKNEVKAHLHKTLKRKKRPFFKGKYYKKRKEIFLKNIKSRRIKPLQTKTRQKRLLKKHNRKTKRKWEDKLKAKDKPSVIQHD